MEHSRCPWLPADRPLYRDYHDTEWGVPSREPRYLFEMICLEGAQAGLSWWTVLQKRKRYQEVFHHFDPAKIASMTDSQLESLVSDPGIIRHRGKIFSVRENAIAWLNLQNPVEFLWSFVDGSPKIHNFDKLTDYQSTSPEAEALSKALKKKGFKFVGGTTMYAFMQAVGMFNDHSTNCFKRSL